MLVLTSLVQVAGARLIRTQFHPLTPPVPIKINGQREVVEPLSEFPADWQNIGMAIFDSEFWSILWLSVRVSGSAVLISSLVGIPLGAWLGLSGGRFRSVWKTIVHTGMAMPPVFVGLLIYLLISHSGPLGWMRWVYTPSAMIIAQVVLCLPFVIGITMSAVSSVPFELIAQLRSLGASDWQLRWTIIREARVGVVLAVAAAFGRSISEVGAVMIVGGGGIHGHTQVLTTAIVEKTSAGQFEFAIALGLVLMSLALSVNFLILFLRPDSFYRVPVRNTPG